MDKITVLQKNNEISVRLTATSFLHHQVRNIVGTLELVGAGKWTLEQFQTAFDAKDRVQGGPTAPAQGLYLTRIDY